MGRKTGGMPVLHLNRIKKGKYWARRLGSDVRRPVLVAAGLAFAGDQDDRSAGADPAALARAVGEGVQNASDGGIGREDPEQYHGDSRERHDERNQYRAQDQPTFTLSAGLAARTRLAQSTTLPSLTLASVSN
jgi:hypothetical protein